MVCPAILVHRTSEYKQWQAWRMAQWVEAPVTKPDNLSPIPRTHMGLIEKRAKCHKFLFDPNTQQLKLQRQNHPP